MAIMGKPAFALMAERGTGKYVGAAFIIANRAIHERLWKRVQEHAGPKPGGCRRARSGLRRNGSSPG